MCSSDLVANTHKPVPLFHMKSLFALVLMSATAHAQPLFFFNGFEHPNIVRTGVDYKEAAIYYQTFQTGSTIGPWKVSQGSVDIVRHKTATAAEGKQSLDLSGTEAGAIQRTFESRPGATYRLNFDFSGNPIGGALSVMEVRWNGQVAGTFKYDTAPQTNSYQVDMHWEKKKLTLKASERKSTLEFRSLTPGQSGPALDKIRLERVR